MWNGPENHDKDEQRGKCELNRRNTKKGIKMSKRSVSPKITKVSFNLSKIEKVPVKLGFSNGL